MTVYISKDQKKEDHDQQSEDTAHQDIVIAVTTEGKDQDLLIDVINRGQIQEHAIAQTMQNAPRDPGQDLTNLLQLLFL